MTTISKLGLGLILLMAFSFSACSSEKFVSSWNEDKIIVDGNQSDWKGKLNYIEDERVAVGVFNDNENLFLCLTTDDRGKIMQLLNLGMTLWLIPDDDRVKTIGIKYPIKSDDFDMRSMRNKSQKGNEEDFLRKYLEEFQNKQNELQIVNEDNYSLYAYPINNDSGIRIKMGESMHQLVYEISIPIADNNMSEFYMDLFPGDNLTIGFETGEFQRPSSGDRGSGMTGGGRQPTGGMTGGGRSGRGGYSRMQGDSMPDRPEPIEIEIDVRLAKSP